MGIEVIGMIGTRSASELDGPQVSLIGGHVDAPFLKKFSLAHEDAGFDKVLIGYGSSGPDGWAVASYVSSFTDRLGFLIALRSQAINLGWVLALLVGGLIAAPIAAWLVRHVPPRVLGSAVGGVIIITNARTLLKSDWLDASSGTRWLVYLIMGLVAFAGTVIAIVSVALPFYWTEAAAELAKEHPTLDTVALYPKIYAIFALGIMILGLIWAIMRKLLAIIASVEDGNPFVLANAIRLKAIGWLMVAVQLIGIPLAVVASETADLFGDNNVDFNFSLNGILSILLVFILAGIFEHGAQMREELEGTV